ncbi:hypothetical protein BX616_001995 [Lobosporangium transversale]|nr:hypothetical protein BX616_001995 [Lobosporangium transversale]
MPLQQHASVSSGVSLAGVCTVHIGPHIFLDTKFYTALSPPASFHSVAPTTTLATATATATTTPDYNPMDQGNYSSAKALKQEQGQEQELYKEESSVSDHSQQHVVVMEFKENPGIQWLFPEEASLEFTPAHDTESAKISASFTLPVSQHQTTTLVILKATPALREGLELAVKGPCITTNPSLIYNKPKTVRNRQPTPPTYHEETSEILGSGKSSSTNHNISSAKRKMDTMIDGQKPSKSKRLKEGNGKGSGPTVKKATVSGASKKNGVSGSSSTSSQQKRCAYCECTTTPMWRRGPDGPSTLCNACGVKWKHGKILQGTNDTHQHPKPLAASISSSSPNTKESNSTHHSSSSKGVKTSLAMNRHTRRGEDKKTHNKTANKHTSPGQGNNHFEKKSSPRLEINGLKTVETERIVPVKKRHSISIPNNLPGPRMVPIHELDEQAKMPPKHLPSSKQYGQENKEVQSSNGWAKQKKNGLVHVHQHQHQHQRQDLSETLESSASSASTQSDTNDFKMDMDMDMDRDSESIYENSEAATDSLSLYNKVPYKNSITAFPLHFPTISIAFGPNNAFYQYPNCTVVLYEDHFQIQLVQDGERTEIDVWKEGIEGTEFQAIDAGDGENMIIMKALLRQYLTRFDKELLNPDRNESLIVFRFRERLDGGGPFVRPLLEHWLTTDIPIPLPPSNDSDNFIASGMPQ